MLSMKVTLAVTCREKRSPNCYQVLEIKAASAQLDAEMIRNLSRFLLVEKTKTGLTC